MILNRKYYFLRRLQHIEILYDVGCNADFDYYGNGQKIIIYDVFNTDQSNYTISG